MPLLHLEPLPPRTTKGELLVLLIETGGLRREQVGKIDLQGHHAVIEVPAGWEQRLVKALDGNSFRDRRLRVWSSGGEIAVDADDHFGRLARLLKLEADEEARQALGNLRRLSAADAERTGECLVGLVIIEEASGLGGRCIVTLAKRSRTQPLPWNRFEPGKPALLSLEGGKDDEGRRGVVCERSPGAILLALPEPPDDEAGTIYRLSVANDEIARQRQLAALERARGASRERLAELRDVLIGEADPTFAEPVEVEFLDPTLNATQQDAVRFALSATDLAIIHGPPGTGKTTAVVEVIRQAIRRARVVACAPSNLAVDNLLERLLAGGERAVRLGHPARVLPGLREHTLDLLVEEHTDSRLARKLARDAFILFRKAGKFTRARPEPGAKQAMRQEARALLADARRLEAQAVDQILGRASVVCATTTGLDSEVLGRLAFDLAVIDEAGQSTEPGCWPPLLRCQRVVLAGDHCQLPPTVLSREAEQGGFAVSLMERLVAHYGATVTRRLDVQYRMHADIMAYPSAQLYDGALVADPSVRAHVLAELPGVEAKALTETPIHFVDTAGAGYDETPEPGGESRLNPQEAALVIRKTQALLDAGVRPEAIAVIAPYGAQVRLLREKLRVPGLEVDSIDGFQGREKEAVVLSLVRSNPAGEIGFLSDIRRMNVALTRARRKLIVVGDSATLAAHPFYAGLVAHFEAIGAYASVWEETE